MLRDEFRAIARTRIREARILLTNGEPGGAYYLAGYAVECGLKACIARRFLRNDIPEPSLVQKIYTHDLDALVTIAGLRTSLDARRAASGTFQSHWDVVRGWSERSRYAVISMALARDMVRAVGQRSTGVMAWLRTNW